MTYHISEKQGAHQAPMMEALNTLPKVGPEVLLEYVKLREEHIKETTFIQALVLVGKGLEEARDLFRKWKAA